MEGSTKNHIEQGRSKAAYQYVEEAKKNLSSSGEGRTPKHYKSYVRKMSMLIKTNGVGAAVAFAFAKGSKDGNVDVKSAWGLLYTQLAAWLQTDQKQLLDLKNLHLLSKALTETNSNTYRAVTVEFLALLSWMRRFVDALIEGDAQE